MPGGTLSVVPIGPGICISSGIFPTVTVFDAHVAGGTTTDVHGFELGDGTNEHGGVGPTGAPMRSVSLSAGAPPIVTWVCFGIRVTLPPCTHWMIALMLSAGNGIGTSIVAGLRWHNPT